MHHEQPVAGWHRSPWIVEAPRGIDTRITSHILESCIHALRFAVNLCPWVEARPVVDVGSNIVNSDGQVWISVKFYILFAPNTFGGLPVMALTLLGNGIGSGAREQQKTKNHKVAED
jgi:hypothetical protein